MVINQFSICRFRNLEQVVPIQTSISIDDIVFKLVAWQLVNLSIYQLNLLNL